MDPGLRQEIHNLHAEVCSGLADPTRILILYALHEQPCFVNELADRLNLPQPTISRHLKVLRERGLCRSNREGQAVNYSLEDDRVIEALDLLRAILADRLRARAKLAASVPEIS